MASPFAHLGSGPVDRGTFSRFQASIDPTWIEKALESTGTASIRRRRFPAEQVVWLVVGMALYRDLTIAEVVRELDLVLPDSGDGPIAPSAVIQARAKLGDAPLRWLFETTGEKWAKESARFHSWRGLAVFGVDSTTINVPDSPENRAHFGASGSGRGVSGYPQARLVTLMALRSHLLAGARIAPWATSERVLARELWATVPDDSLVIADRNFVYANDLLPLVESGTNKHWLGRARKLMQWETVRRHSSRDETVNITVGRDARRANPELPEAWTARAIRYRRRGYPEQTLLTSLLDAEKYPAAEIVALYHERWEVELGYDEVKTEMLEREEAIRSKSPAGVAQELWGVALAYNLVRLEMEKAAQLAGVPPVRMSFVLCMRAIKVDLLRSVFLSPGTLGKHVEKLRETLALFVLPERRVQRLYPRAVKVKMSGYPRKRPPGPKGRGRAK